MLKILVPLVTGLLLLAGCQKKAESKADSTSQELDAPTPLILTSPAFVDGGAIPMRYTCDSENVSPALAWTGVPGETKSLALIMDDPDAPNTIWVHWVIYDIPPSDSGLAEGVTAEPELEDSARQGMNSFKKYGYGGPCPPPGKPHRYFFKLYALDFVPDLPDTATKEQLLGVMDGHILAQTQIVGTYGRAE